MQAEPSGVLKSCVMICSVLCSLRPAGELLGGFVPKTRKTQLSSFLPFPFQESPSSWDLILQFMKPFLSMSNWLFLLSFCFLCYILPGKWDKCRVMGFASFVCHVTWNYPGERSEGVPILLPVLIWFDYYVNIIQFLSTSQFSAAPVKAFSFFFLNVSIAGTSLRASLGLCF